MRMNKDGFKVDRNNNTFVGGREFIPLKEIRSVQVKPGCLISFVQWIGLISFFSLIVIGVVIILAYKFFGVFSYFFGVFSYYELALGGIPLIGICAAGFFDEYLEKKAGYILKIVGSRTIKLKGKHSEVGKARDEIEKLKENLRKDDHVQLEDYSVSIPHMPDRVFTVLRWGLRNLLMSGAWRVETGDWVSAGDELVNYYGHYDKTWSRSTTISLVAPFAGKIVKRGLLGPGGISGGDLSKSENVLVVIQPVKGSDTQKTASKAYNQVITYVATFIDEPHKLRKGGLSGALERWLGVAPPEFKWEAVKEDLEALKVADDRIQPSTSR